MRSKTKKMLQNLTDAVDEVKDICSRILSPKPKAAKKDDRIYTKSDNSEMVG